MANTEPLTRQKRMKPATTRRLFGAQGCKGVGDLLNGFWIVGFLIFFGAACSPAVPSQIPETPLATDTHFAEVDILPATPTKTVRPTSTARPTPLPTLEPTEKLAREIDLQATNGGCQYPCWWGITPGIDQWSAVFQELRPLSVRNLQPLLSNGISDYYIEFPLPSSNLIVHIFVRRDDIIDVIRVGQNYPLIDFLRDYGEPKEMWIFSDGLVPGPSTFILALFYPEKGVMAAYLGNSTFISQDQVEWLTICGDDFGDYGPVWFFAPSSKESFDELPLDNLVGGTPTSVKLRRIDEYTNLDEHQFFLSMMKDPQNTCLETQADIWPNPDLLLTLTP